MGEPIRPRTPVSNNVDWEASEPPARLNLDALPTPRTRGSSGPTSATPQSGTPQDERIVQRLTVIAWATGIVAVAVVVNAIASVVFYARLM